MYSSSGRFNLGLRSEVIQGADQFQDQGTQDIVRGGRERA